MLFQETLTAVMVAENTIFLKFILSDTLHILSERTKMSGKEKASYNRKEKRKEKWQCGRKTLSWEERDKEVTELLVLAMEERILGTGGF